MLPSCYSGIKRLVSLLFLQILTNATAILTTSVSREDWIASTRKDRITACVPRGSDTTIVIESAEVNKLNGNSQ